LLTCPSNPVPGINKRDDPDHISEVICIRRAVKLQLENSKSILIVVTSAENDVAKQKIMKFVKEVDPGGLRTLAVITKPDLLSSGSDDEAGLVSYARNDTPGFKFKHGWHVIKNRSYETRHDSLAQRDKNEAKFFKGSIWEEALGLEFLGIDALRYVLASS
jgi:hypothetical protein